MGTTGMKQKQKDVLTLSPVLGQYGRGHNTYNSKAVIEPNSASPNKN